MEVPVSAAGRVLEQHKQVLAVQSSSQHELGWPWEESML